MTGVNLNFFPRQLQRDCTLQFTNLIHFHVLTNLYNIYMCTWKIFVLYYFAPRGENYKRVKGSDGREKEDDLTFSILGCSDCAMNHGIYS